VKTEKPWGYELIWAQTDKYVGKLLHVREGTKLSLQYHRAKDETIMVQSGKLELITEEDGRRLSRVMSPGESRHIPPGTVHRMVALEDCDIIEVSTTELDDVVRLEDDYGRADSTEESR
jgi:quercetin dioxygenase-like cupin family protein